MIVEIEGIDGVGKTTQCALLRARLQQQGRKAVVVKDLENTELGKGIKNVLVRNESRPPEVELFSFLACKSQLYSRVIIPIVSDGGIVICDRGIGSFISYFEAIGFPRLFLLNAIDLVINGLRPDITILLDVSVKEAVRRKAKKPVQSKFDLMGDDFFHRQRAVFLDLSQASTWTVVDGLMSIEETHSVIVECIGSVLP